MEAYYYSTLAKRVVIGRKKGNPHEHRIYFQDLLKGGAKVYCQNGREGGMYMYYKEE